MHFANRPAPSFEFHYIMNMSRDAFVQQIKAGFIPIHYRLDPVSTIPSVFYNKMDWLYNNRHLLETMSVEEFLLQGSHVDFIFRETAKTVDIDAYLEKVYDLSLILRKDTCSLRLLHQLWNLKGII
jgi:hypothetical protein